MTCIADWELSVQRPALCPEIALLLLAPEVELERNYENFPAGDPPYFAFCWASGQALARYLLDHPERVRGRRVLDLGAGSGVAAIAAALAGADSVVARDWDPRAERAVRANAALNGVGVEIARDTGGSWDLLLAADVCYESDSSSVLVEHAAHGAVLVSDPERRSLPWSDRAALARYRARTTPELDETTPGAAVYELGPK